MYTMLLSVPLEGPLEKGGVIFVLRSGSTGQVRTGGARGSTGLFDACPAPCSRGTAAHSNSQRCRRLGLLLL